MTATTANSHGVEHPPIANTLERLAAAAASAWSLAFLAVAVLLVCRRLSGALHVPLPAFQAAAVGGAVGLMGPAVHWAFRRQCGQRRWYLPLSLVYSASVAAFAGSLAIRGTAAASVLVLGGLLAAGELGGWWLAYRRSARRSSSRTGPAASSSPSAAALQAPNEAASGGLAGPPLGAAYEAEEEDDERLPDEVWQRITRAVDEHGNELVFGVVRCEFAPGQRQCRVHIAFCPPLTRRPELSADPLEVSPVKIRASMLEAFGTCLEVKRAAPGNEPLTAQIQFFASAAPPDDASDRSSANSAAD